MFDISTFAYTLTILCMLAIVLWIASRIKNDVGIVDSFWSLMILLAGVSFFMLDTSGQYSHHRTKNTGAYIIISMGHTTGCTYNLA